MHLTGDKIYVNIILLWIGWTAAEAAVATPPSPAIVGGRVASPGQFPYQLSMIRENTHWCGAVILSNFYAVTAAHCVATATANSRFTVVRPSDIRLRAGSIQISSGGIIVYVAQITVHPSYQFPAFDISTLRFTTRLNFNSFIRPIGLATSLPPPGSMMLASGWGSTTTRSPYPQQLNYVYIPLLDNDTCFRQMERMSATVLCGRTSSRLGICQGDSGGPAVYNGRLLGLVSYTPRNTCKSDIYYDGFANVPVLRAWIETNSDLRRNG